MTKMKPQDSPYFHPLRRPVSLGALMVLLCLLGACGRGDLTGRTTIATVNGEKIYREELDLRLSLQKGILSPKAFANSLNKRDALEEEILDALITEKIMLQRARALNLAVAGEELEGRLTEIRKDYGEEFFNQLAAQNVRYEDWREQIKQEMLFGKLVAADVNARISVSDEEAQDYYDENPDFCKSEARVRALQIFIRDEQKAKDIKERLDRGEDFAKLAREASIGPEKARGGDLGWVSRQTMPEPLDQTLFRLATGEISPVIKSAYGFHILKVTETQRARTRNFDACKGDIVATVRAEKENEAFTAWLSALKAGAVIKKEKRTNHDQPAK